MMRSEMRAHHVSLSKKEQAHASSTPGHSESKKYVRMAVARHPAGRQVAGCRMDEAGAVSLRHEAKPRPFHNAAYALLT
jgi:hypothetical protein